MYRFDDNHVIIPIAVIDSLEAKVAKDDENSESAKEALENIDTISSSQNDFSIGLSLESGGTIRIEINNDHETEGKTPFGNLDMTKATNRILLVAYNLNEKSKKGVKENPGTIVVVSNSAGLRAKARAFGLKAESYKNDSIDFNTLYSGRGEKDIEISDDQMLEFTQKGSTKYEDVDALPNQYFMLKSPSVPSPLPTRYLNGAFYAVNNCKDHKVEGFKPRNPEQNIALDALLNREIEMVSLLGKAGTGKTLVAIAAGLECVKRGYYQKVMITRPIWSVGQGLGFTPGTIDEKIEPWMQPVMDALRFIYSNKKDSSSMDMATVLSPYKTLIEQGKLIIQPLSYSRGITVPDQILIVDETQNLTPHEMKTISTRIGEKAKLVITGDPFQIDNQYVTEHTNGLTHFIHRMKGQDNYAHVTMIKGERSRVATQCSELL